jgi:CubicO group peptidase (beta-lactamase class C family)
MNDTILPQLIEEFSKDIPVRIRKENIPGLSVAIVDVDGILWEAGFGITDKHRKLQVTARTIFSLQSCSKTFTATAIMLAVQDGLLNLDTPIKEYLPGLKLQSRFELQPEEKITIRHLLSHKAGFTHEAPVGNNFVYDTGKASFEDHIASIRDTWLRFPVGQRYSYSNLGIDLAGYILQVASGFPFADYVKTKLFEPLGMERSSFDFRAIAAEEDRAIGHDMVYDAIGLPVPLIVPMMPSGGIYTSAGDAARFIQFHLNGGSLDGRNILDRKYLEEMYTIPLPLSGQTDGYALGIVIHKQHGTLRYTHSGGGFGFLSDMIWYPELGVGIVLLTNSVNHHLMWWYTNHLLDKVLDLPKYKDRKSRIPSPVIPPAVPAPITKKTESLENFAGHYVGRIPDQCQVKPGMAGLTIRFLSDKKLHPLVFYTDDKAFIQHKEIKTSGDSYSLYQFILKDSGKPSHIISIQDGNFYDFNEGPNDVPRDKKKEWRKYQGNYNARGSVLPITVKVYRYKGDLYIIFSGCRLKLEEYQPGLFFTSSGEALDFRGQDPVYMGLVGQKIGLKTQLRYGMIMMGTFFRLLFAKVWARLFRT